MEQTRNAATKAAQARQIEVTDEVINKLENGEMTAYEAQAAIREAARATETATQAHEKGEADTTPDAGANGLTREEYAVIAAAFRRLGCDSLITYSGYFGDFAAFSFGKFWQNMPKAVQVLAEYAASEQAAERGERKEIQGFINALGQVSETLAMIQESSPIFDEAEKLCDALDNAFWRYERGAGSPKA